MSADTNAPVTRFTIEFPGFTSMNEIALVLRKLSGFDVIVRTDPGGFGKAHLLELNSLYNLNIQAAEKAAPKDFKSTDTGLGPYKDTLHEILSRSLFVAKSSASDMSDEYAMSALAVANAAMRLIMLMDNAT